MRAQWEALHESLAQAVGTLEAHRRFKDVKVERGALERFDDPVSLLAYLNSPGGYLDEKDAIYKALVEAIQEGGQDASLALHLVWLGVWPALDAIYRRRIQLFIRMPEELVSELSDCLNEVIAEMDFTRVRRVVATLTRSTERKVLERCQENWSEAARRTELAEGIDVDAFRTGEPRDERESLFGIEPDASDDAEITALRQWLVSVVGDDADLVIGAAIYEESQKALAERLGLTHAAARKRFQRAVARLRKRLQGKR